MVNRLYSLPSRARVVLAGLACVCFGLAASPAFATAPVLPTTGVAVDAWIPVVVTAFGTLVAAVVGAYFAFLLIKKGVMWGRKAFG